MTEPVENLSDLGTYIKDYLQSKGGFEDYFYGDQQAIPKTPALAVETTTHDIDVNDTGIRAVNTFTVLVLIYHDKVQSTQLTRLECEQMAEQVKKNLHADKTMGGRVIFGHVARIEPGYALRGGSMLRATRVTWRGTSKTLI